MNHVNSDACNELIVINPFDFILIVVGCGVGYFVIGYLCIKSVHDSYKQIQILNQTEPAIQI